MNKMMLYILTLAISVPMLAIAEPADTIRMLHGVEIVSSVKENGGIRQQPSAVSQIEGQQIEDARVLSLKDVSAMVPNLFIPNYGSRLTSAIYIRGIGSRINTPAVGMYVDDVPYVDKSAFDFNFHDVECIDVLRGPQGTLYGRNTMGGLVRIRTRNPFHYQGTDVRMGYATGDHHHNASLTHYHRVSNSFAFSAGGYYEGSMGFFRNDLTDKRVDNQRTGGGRMRAVWLPAEGWKVDASASYDHTSEGAYPYYYTGTLAGEEPYPHLTGLISNNREHTYRRSLLNAGVNVERQAERWRMNAITGFQSIRDRMFMDQDFLSPDIYTLEQKQRINTLTEEITLKNRNTDKWERVTGAHLMYQWLHTDGPVVFYRDGLCWLESNINPMLPTMDRIPMLQGMGFRQGMIIGFRGDELLMDGNFSTPSLGAALFHQSTYHITEGLSASLGIRLDYEHQRMRYCSPASVEYSFSMPNAFNERMSVNLQDLQTDILYDGRLTSNRFKAMPRVALKYDFDANNNIYASAARGLRSGGYNLQMFSDLIQGAMRVQMMEGVKDGVGHYMEQLVQMNPNMPKQIPDPENPSTMISLPDYVRRMMGDNMPQFETPSTRQVAYRPEYSWNFELGTHLTLFDRVLSVDAAVFYSRIYDQQIARFAPSGLGRMMVNAGTSQSCGAELSFRWNPNRHFAFLGNYGYTHAEFVDYDAGDGREYSGNRVPYVPQHTMSADASYTWNLRNTRLHAITLGANTMGVGRVYWTEDNSASQPFYAQLGARLALAMPRVTMTLWGRNLTDTSYNTFYFESAGRGFEQHGAPWQLGVDVRLHF